MIKPIETIYKGYRFRSRLEARWAVFFDACGVRWEYEPEGYNLGDGLYYLPDFLLPNEYPYVYEDKAGNDDLYVEVKGIMTDKDAEKIWKFYDEHNGILILPTIPDGNNIDEIIDCIYKWSQGYEEFQGVEGYTSWPNPYTLMGLPVIPGINKEGRFELFGYDYSDLVYMDEVATLKAYNIARQARFEHGEKPNKESNNEKY